jgi:hypothetical protein
MVTVHSNTADVDAARNGLVPCHRLLLFFILSYILTWGYFWLIWSPFRLPDSVVALGGFGPAASAFLVLSLASDSGRFGLPTVSARGPGCFFCDSPVTTQHQKSLTFANDLEQGWWVGTEKAESTSVHGRV